MFRSKRVSIEPYNEMVSNSPKLTWLQFDKLKKVDQALLYLQCSPELVQDVLHSPEKYYEPIRIKRRRGSGKPRIVYKVHNDLRRLHRSISLGLAPHIQNLPPTVQGFREQYNIVTNASMHCGQAELVTADIRDFFGSITTRKVQALFESLGTSFHVALMLARLCTLNDSLVQGGRASPAIANLVAYSLDNTLLSTFPNVKYSRYVDDLAFSGDKCPSKTEIQASLKLHNFTLKEGSFKLTTSGNGQYVTGLNVDGQRPKVPRRERRLIDRALHVGDRYSLEQHYINIYKRDPTPEDLDWYANKHLLGKITSYGRVDPELYNQWRSKLADIVAKESLLIVMKKIQTTSQ
ncbi:reverse transcriptase family protein [Leptothoe sp. EHU-05/26/07-4]